MSPSGHQRGVGAISGVVVLDVPFYFKVEESGWSSLGHMTVCLATIVSCSQLLSFFLPLPLEPYPALFPPLLDLSPPRALLHHWPKSCSSAMSAHGCFLVDQQRIHPSAFLAHGGDPELLLSLGKMDGLVWHSGLFGFPVLKSSCPASGRCICNGCLMRSSLHGQNPH
jgi:hypothetical protein